MGAHVVSGGGGGGRDGLPATRGRARATGGGVLPASAARAVGGRGEPAPAGRRQASRERRKAADFQCAKRNFMEHFEGGLVNIIDIP